VAKGFSMKALNKLVVMSDTYRMASVTEPAIFVKSGDHPVTPVVDAGSCRHGIVHVGVTEEVQPVAGVPDTVLLAGEQMVHHLLVRVGSSICQECGLLRRRGRNADEVQVDAAEQGGFIGWGCRRQTLIGSFGCQERIDRVSGGSQFRDVRPVD
jgi:hypothetical protein